MSAVAISPPSSDAAPDGRDVPVDPVAAGYRIAIAAKQRPSHVLTTLRDATDPLSALEGAANVVMQLVNSPIGHGVMESRVESGSLYRHPLKRSRTTFTYLAVSIIGSAEDRERYRDAVNVAHRQVHDISTSPVKYNAMNRDLQLWVAMCLYVGFEDTHQLLHGRMDRAQRALFYRDAAPLGTTLQVHPDMWPSTPDDFDAKWIELCQSKVRPDDDVRKYLDKLVDVSFVNATPGVMRRLSRFQTAGFLAPRFREAMHIEWSERDQLRFDRFWRVAATINTVTPRVLRQVPYRVLLADMRVRARLRMPLV